MAYYWRGKNVPELAGLAPAKRSEWWYRARMRGTSMRAKVVALWPTLAAIVLSGVFTDHHWGGHFAIVMAFAPALVIAVLWDAYLTQPRCRQWLRENLHEVRVDGSAAPVSQP